MSMFGLSSSSTKSRAEVHLVVDSLPGPWRITFDTNPDDCNLGCVMCEEHSELSERNHLRRLHQLPHRRMDIEVVRQVVAEMVPKGLREIIPSTMGEPLLYAQFDEIVALCREHGLKLNLTTNGTWPRRGPTRWAGILCPISSDVKVSWNGTDAETQETIMRGISLRRGTEDLRRFLSVRDAVASEGGNRCRVTLQCTFMERNLAELPSLIELAASLGVDRVKGHHLWVHFRELATEELRRTGASRARWNAIVEECRSVAEKHPKPDGTRVQLDNFLLLPEHGPAQPPPAWECPFLGREAWVNYAGRFDPCCAPDAERRSLGYFGLATGPGGLTAIWEGQLYRTLASGYLDRAVCQKCTLRRPTEVRGGDHESPPGVPR
jgi:MoaA/NifB/PqqE/SkfB family radical SAM enzyme